jgi:hypothetical protein
MSCGIYRIIKLNDAIKSFPIVVIDSNGNDSTKYCQFSWSVDGVCWTGWTIYDNYLRITNQLETDFYLRIRINFGLNQLVVNGCATNDYNISIDSSSTFIQDFCGETNIFQPYNNLDCALQLQQQLSDSVVCMFGIPIYYFRCDPKPNSADYTFKEYVLHNVVAVKQIKLMIKDGQMPSSNPKLTEFDFDWETDWETEISKSQFAAAFGDKAIPKYGDFIYIPMMQRMWDVNAAYDEKNEGLMWRSTTWKLQLVKYSDSTAYSNNEFEDIIDSLIPNTYENTFGQYEAIEQERETQIAQITAPMFAATNLYDIFMEDAIRKQYTKNDVTIIDKQYCHRANVTARNMYRFKNENGCITYQNGICGEDGTLMFIFETPGSLDNAIERDIIQFGNLRVNLKFDAQKYTINFGNLSANLEAFKSYMCILKWNRTNFTTSMELYNYSHREDIPIYKLRPEMYWFDFENPLYSEVSDYNIDLISEIPLHCQIHSYPVQITNIKYYNKYLEEQETFTEAVKYTTNHENCVINDLARHINSGHGYAVK